MRANYTFNASSSARDVTWVGETFSDTSDAEGSTTAPASKPAGVRRASSGNGSTAGPKQSSAAAGAADGDGDPSWFLQ